MSKLNVAILGLGRVGASIGLALKRAMTQNPKLAFELVGYDSQQSNEKAAQKLGAVTRIERTPYAAVANKDLVVVALPYDETRETYKALREDLRDGVVLVDFSPLKQPVIGWAQQYLKPTHHVIGAAAIINPNLMFDAQDSAENAREDLFDGGAVLLSPALDSVREAIDLAYNFSILLGGKPRFLDPNEHDALMAYTEHLPLLLGATFYDTLQRHSAWEDMQALTSANFAAQTLTLKRDHPDALRDLLLNNRDNALRALSALIDTLQEARAALAADNRDALEALLVRTSDDYAQWINRRFRAEWDKPNVPIPTSAESSGIMTFFLGSKLANRLAGKKDES